MAQEISPGQLRGGGFWAVTWLARSKGDIGATAFAHWASVAWAEACGVVVMKARESEGRGGTAPRSLSVAGLVDSAMVEGRSVTGEGGECAQESMRQEAPTSP